MRGAEGRAVRLEVSPEEAGHRLDVLIAARLPELSRSRAAQLLGAGHVRVNGRVARKSLRPAAGDVVEVALPPPEPAGLVPEAMALRVAYEDEDLLVVDKPAGLVVHPAPGHRQGTLVHGLLHHVPDLAGVGGVLRPGIVHRLDKDTSGLMVVAKHDAAHRGLSAALKRREIRRIYLCAAWGHLPAERLTVEAPIGRAQAERRRMAVVPDGRPATTHFRVLERWRAAELLQAELETGRTHQIRVHLAHRGHPVVGDRTYGGGAERGISGPDRSWAVALARRAPRQLLHARVLQFAHPRDGREVRLESALPEDLAAVIEWARRTSGEESGR
jgi:23S rRNA pseudouridine1911/1915/1917 synthase